ncbi:hypothetical protein CJA_0658 [Cellvibrio japonicus Ueda107]|uniref:Uncharacterized protein n=1 Tax=Cellvibrio japonicus (strain Ueda107) TaxID=498211 RepID=B3PJQ0_CELJU|nr:hypothetical protein CJA_0658 [Cellvibrio japonicus Ueda107]
MLMEYPLLLMCASDMQDAGHYADFAARIKRLRIFRLFSSQLAVKLRALS